MNIYKVERTDDADVGEYFEFVCLASTVAEAKRLDPETGMWMFVDKDNNFVVRTGKPMRWTNSLNNIKVTMLGVAVENLRTVTTCKDGSEVYVEFLNAPAILAASVQE